MDGQNLTHGRAITDYAAIYAGIRNWIEDRSIQVYERVLPRGKAGEFNGLSVTMNSMYELEERSNYLVHALGSIVLWSQNKPAIENLFTELRNSKRNKDTHRSALKRAIHRYRDFETESSEFAVWLLAELRVPEAVATYTTFMRADLESMTELHWTGGAPVWHSFFARWKQEVSYGIRKIIPFNAKAIPAFRPLEIEVQEILQRQDPIEY